MSLLHSRLTLGRTELTRTSVEAGTIIIACCIPVLQPLVDLLFGRRTLNGSSGYQNYGSSNNGHLKGGIELDKSARGHRSGNQSHVSTKHTASSRIHDSEVDSQESILRDDDVKGHSRGHGSRGMENDGRIVRTDVVTVTYDQENIDPMRANPPARNTSWVKM